MNYNFIKENNISNDMLLELGAFTLLWAQFEFVYCENDCTKDQLREIPFSISISNELIERCNELINKLFGYIQRNKTSITEDDIRVKLYSKKRSSVDCEVQKVLMYETNNENLLIGALFIVRRLRDNMFHGLKECYAVNQQLQLFQAANNLLNEMIKSRFM